MRRSAALALLLALALASPGSAAELQLDADERVRFQAAPGEVNVVEVISATSATVVRDTGGAPLRIATDRCRAIDAASARCEPIGVEVVLGDGDDTARVAAQHAVARGGSGNDTIAVAHEDAGGYGEDGDDVVFGVSVLDGGPGADRLSGDAGTQTLEGGPGADVLDGGPGRDVAVFRTAPGPVTADLAAGTTSDGDALRNVEDLIGGPFADVLRGDDRGNLLAGGDGGTDVLVGRGGSDRLAVARSDRADGGPGADVIDVEGAAGRVTCGAGRDRAVLSSSGLDAGDCETVGLVEASVILHGLRRGRDLLVARVGCETFDRCSVPLLLRGRGRVLARGRARVAGERTGDVALVLTPAGRRVLRRGSRPALVLQAGRTRGRLRVRIG